VSPVEAQIAREENENISYLLIDEFQDVDPVQFEIFSMLLGENFGNKLVAFGDPKQSIYGFRGADVSIFNKLNRDEKITAVFTDPFSPLRSHAYGTSEVFR